jgi:hypothetical protein
LQHHGKPVAFYFDEHSIFRVSREDAASGDGISRFSCHPGKVIESEVAAVCSCGEVYCKKCLESLIPGELDAPMKDSARKGHTPTLPS